MGQPCRGQNCRTAARPGRADLPTRGRSAIRPVFRTGPMIAATAPRAFDRRAIRTPLPGRSASQRAPSIGPCVHCLPEEHSRQVLRDDVRGQRADEAPLVRVHSRARIGRMHFGQGMGIKRSAVSRTVEEGRPEGGSARGNRVHLQAHGSIATQAGRMACRTGSASGGQCHPRRPERLTVRWTVSRRTGGADRRRHRDGNGGARPAVHSRMFFAGVSGILCNLAGHA